MYPSVHLNHRTADAFVHGASLLAVGVMCGLVSMRIFDGIGVQKTLFSILYMICLLGSALASAIYHFGPWHNVRLSLRRVDHAAIYGLIAATITAILSDLEPTFVFIFAGIIWTVTLVAMLWKIFANRVKSRWSTFSYIGLGAIGFVGLVLNFTELPVVTAITIFVGAGFYLSGIPFYANKAMPYRYAIWHIFVLLGTISFFVGIFQVV